MKAIDQVTSKVCVELGEIARICREHEYDVTPTLILRHADGNNMSLMLGNDTVEDLRACIDHLFDEGRQSSASTYDSAVKLAMDGLDRSN